MTFQLPFKCMELLRNKFKSLTGIRFQRPYHSSSPDHGRGIFQMVIINFLSKITPKLKPVVWQAFLHFAHSGTFFLHDGLHF